jgi:hypothetical protein
LFLFEKKKMIAMRRRLFLWQCSNEEGDDTTTIAFFSGV